MPEAAKYLWRWLLARLGYLKGGPIGCRLRCRVYLAVLNAVVLQLHVYLFYYCVSLVYWGDQVAFARVRSVPLRLTLFECTSLRWRTRVFPSSYGIPTVAGVSAFRNTRVCTCRKRIVAGALLRGAQLVALPRMSCHLALADRLAIPARRQAGSVCSMAWTPH